MRKFIAVVVAVAGLGLLTAAPVSAAPASGYTSLTPASPPGGGEVTVTAVINARSPIVPYEYSIENKCWLSGRFNGHFDTYERFDLAGPWFLDTGGHRYTTAVVNLNDVPSGSSCKVTIMKGPSAVKGSTTSYSVT